MKYYPMHFEFSKEEKETLEHAANIIGELLSYLDEDEVGELYRKLRSDPEQMGANLKIFCNVVDIVFPASLD